MNIFDELGAIKAQIADLKALEATLKTDVIRCGGGEGELFRATVSESTRKTVDWKTVAMHLKPSTQLLTAHTKASVVVAVRVSARKAA